MYNAHINLSMEHTTNNVNVHTTVADSGHGSSTHLLAEPATRPEDNTFSGGAGGAMASASAGDGSSASSVSHAPVMMVGFSTNIGGGRINQDAGVAALTSYGAQAAVFDGHGSRGELFARRCTDHIAANPDMPLAEAIPTLHHMVSGMTGGSTGTIVRATNQTNGTVNIDTSYVGDSVAYCYTGGTIRDLNPVDHSCTSVSEYIRVNGLAHHGLFQFARGGNVVPIAERPVFVPGPDGNPVIHPDGGFEYCDIAHNWSVYLVNPMNPSLRLAMTRAIGDFQHASSGVISEPSFGPTINVGPSETATVVIASDGLWDTFTPEQAQEVVHRPEVVGNAQAAADLLLREGLVSSLAAFGSSADNITVAVIYISVPAASPPTDTASRVECVTGGSGVGEAGVTATATTTATTGGSGVGEAGVTASTTATTGSSGGDEAGDTTTATEWVDPFQLTPEQEAQVRAWEDYVEFYQGSGAYNHNEHDEHDEHDEDDERYDRYCRFDTDDYEDYISHHYNPYGSDDDSESELDRRRQSRQHRIWQHRFRLSRSPAKKRL